MANWVYWIYWIFLDGRRLTEGTLYIGRLFFADKISTTRNGVAVGFVLVCSVGHWLSGSVFWSCVSTVVAKILQIKYCILCITQSLYALPSPSFLAVPLYVEQGLKDSASQDWTAVQVVSSVGIVNWSLCLVERLVPLSVWLQLTTESEFTFTDWKIVQWRRLLVVDKVLTDCLRSTPIDERGPGGQQSSSAFADVELRRNEQLSGWSCQ